MDQKRACQWRKITWISFGKVALKSMVCRTPGGGMSICCTIFLIWGSKPMSSIRSASSRAKYLIICNETLALSSKSTNRPGVATRICTPLSNSRSCSQCHNIKLTVRNKLQLSWWNFFFVSKGKVSDMIAMSQRCKEDKTCTH